MRQSSSFVWEASAPLRRRECARALNESRFFVACAVAKPNHSNAKHIRTHALINERIVAERTEFPAFEAAAFCGGGRGHTAGSFIETAAPSLFCRAGCSTLTPTTLSYAFS